MPITRADALTAAKILAQRAGASIANETALWDEALSQLNKVFQILQTSVTLSGTSTLTIDDRVLIERPLSNGYASAIFCPALKRYILSVPLNTLLEWLRVSPQTGEPVYYAQDDKLIRFYPSDSTNRDYTVDVVAPVSAGLTTSPFTNRWDEAIVKLLAHKIAAQVGNFVLAGVCDLRNPGLSTGLGRMAAIAAWEAYRRIPSKGRVTYVGF